MALLVSSSQSTSSHIPPIIGGRIPDVFAQSSEHQFAVIGEAKTEHDIETQRSRNQFKDYLQFLAVRENSLFIVAVPWHCANQTRSLIRSIQRKTKTEHVKVVVLEKLAG